ncbi:tripartite tricarboxylate transporter TctB family protein [Pseudooceanicola sp. 216_PA32_1]|uniref:Tripartite tricarboxylate transporter TctB family protein n=1 Tax=Pseudooceanicola pacificus TaxID=2676438 RepID=A0A844W7E9_9RHOB|nr:tripartite tricarboxylate transporter TctB family protein [Pseudooceanicola pacificus]MWB78684.1 tripartite tricarboxylate transporter TctB family protein [Pseudooceanicola pacificus]
MTVSPDLSRRIAIHRNHIFALIFVAISLGFGIHAWTSMNIGTPADMGPGFFPLMLSLMLTMLSLGVGFVPPEPDEEPLTVVSLRVLVLVLSGPVIFALSIRTLGLLPSVLITVFTVSFASRFARLRNSALLAGGFTAFCVVVFHSLLNLPIPLWGSWITG